jgi:hypothetical protein
MSLASPYQISNSSPVFQSLTSGRASNQAVILFNLASRVVSASAKLNHNVKLIFLSATAAVTIVCLNCFFYERVKELVESILCIPGDDELATVLSKFPAMLFLPKSLVHFRCRS